MKIKILLGLLGGAAALIAGGYLINKLVNLSPSKYANLFRELELQGLVDLSHNDRASLLKEKEITKLIAIIKYYSSAYCENEMSEEIEERRKLLNEEKAEEYIKKALEQCTQESKENDEFFAAALNHLGLTMEEVQSSLQPQHPENDDELNNLQMLGDTEELPAFITKEFTKKVCLYFTQDLKKDPKVVKILQNISNILKTQIPSQYEFIAILIQIQQIVMNDFAYNKFGITEPMFQKAMQKYKITLKIEEGKKGIPENVRIIDIEDKPEIKEESKKIEKDNQDDDSEYEEIKNINKLIPEMPKKNEEKESDKKIEKENEESGNQVKNNLSEIQKIQEGKEEKEEEKKAEKELVKNETN